MTIVDDVDNRDPRRAGGGLLGRGAATLAAVALLGLLGAALPAAAQTAPTTSSPSPSSTSSTSSSTSTTTTLPPLTVPRGPLPAPPRVVPPDPNNLSQQASEVSAAEAQLLSLIDTVNARLASLAGQLKTLDKDVASNQTALDGANKALALRQAALTIADKRVADIAAAIDQARQEMRQRAVAAYVNQPTGEMVNLFLHIRNPAELVDVHAFYQALINAQVKTVARFNRLKKEAVTAAKRAAEARDLARRQQKAVADQQTRLNSIRSTLELVQRESSSQQAQQQSLVGQAAAQKAAFEAAVKQLQAESDAVGALLRQLQNSGGPAIAAANGLLGIPIPGAVITSPFGPRIDPFTGAIGFHPGVDFGARYGVPIEAAADGIVVWAGPNGGYGNCTIVDHGHGLATLYAHQSNILVKVGDLVTRGEVIGQVGSTGYSTGPHLHFEVRANGNPVDPLPYL